MNLLDLSPAALNDWFVSMDEKPFRARQLLRWIYRHGEVDFDAMSNLAKSLRVQLRKHAHAHPPALISDRVSADESRKLLFDVGGGNAVESVFIPEVGRGTLCVSTQVGCALTCSFCATGHAGFNRNLTTAEIIGQLWQVNRVLGHDPQGERIIGNVVLMGMGEPLANLEAVLAALQLMLDDNAYGLSRRRVTVSTSGLVPAMDRLAKTCPVALAVSLHAPNDELRDTLVPINTKYPLKDLLAACERYLQYAPRDFMTFEYVMIDNVNDSLKMARQLLDIARRVSCKINLIPFNPFPAKPYRCSSPQQIRRFSGVLQEAGVVVTTRKTRGNDIAAACGQLAGQVRDKRASRQTRDQLETMPLHVATAATAASAAPSVERTGQVE